LYNGATVFDNSGFAIDACILVRFSGGGQTKRETEE
jgi:hypothetical protein